MKTTTTTATVSDVQLQRQFASALLELCALEQERGDRWVSLQDLSAMLGLDFEVRSEGDSLLRGEASVGIRPECLLREADSEADGPQGPAPAAAATTASKKKSPAVVRERMRVMLTKSLTKSPAQSGDSRDTLWVDPGRMRVLIKRAVLCSSSRSVFFRRFMRYVSSFEQLAARVHRKRLVEVPSPRSTSSAPLVSAADMEAAAVMVGKPRPFSVAEAQWTATPVSSPAAASDLEGSPVRVQPPRGPRPAKCAKKAAAEAAVAVQ